MTHSPPTGPAFENKACCECGRGFAPASGAQKYCSDKCRNGSKKNRRSALSQPCTSDVPNSSQNQSQTNLLSMSNSLTTPLTQKANGGTKRDAGCITPPEERENKRDRNDSTPDEPSEDLQKKSKSQLVAEIIRLRQINAESQQLLFTTEQTCAALKKELNEAKLAFADAAIERASRHSYAEVVKTNLTVQASTKSNLPTLVVQLDTNDASLPPTRETVDEILDSRKDGPIAQNIVCKGDRVLLSFSDEESMNRARVIITTKPAAKELFKSAYVQHHLYPAVMRNVPFELLNSSELIAEIDNTSGNENIKGAIKLTPTIFTSSSANFGHVKLLFLNRTTRDNAVKRGRVFLQSGISCPLVPVDPHREVRRCFKCQQYGHKSMACKRRKDRCGKCAEEHVTKLCTGGPPCCANCGGSHHSGSRSCSVQIEEAQRFARIFC
jgi:hypothetical protein